MKTKSNSRSAFFNPRVLVGFVLCSVGLLLAFAALTKSVAQSLAGKTSAPQAGTWTATGSMNIARQVFTATLLTNGKVLVTGGCSASPCFNGVASAELYDPGTGTWIATGSMTIPRAGHTAILLPDGKVLVAGGVDENFIATSSAELYDPGTGLWTPTGSMDTPRVDHMATLITTGALSGMVLVAGGSSTCGGARPFSIVRNCTIRARGFGLTPEA
jgi:hypothetical protein